MYADSLTVLQLPWSSGSDDKWFKRILVIALLFFVCVALPVSFVTLPELTRAEKEQLPPQLARFVLTQQLVVPPPAVVEAPKIEAQKKPDTEPETNPEIKPEKLPEKRVTGEKTTIKTDDRQSTTTDATARARNTAKQSGLLALANEMSELTDTNNIDASVKARVSDTKASTDVARYDAAAVTATTSATANKVDAGKITGDLKKTELQQRNSGEQTTAATTRREAEKAGAANAAAQGKGGGRAAEDVSIVFNKNKASLYSLYDRERRKNASLKGRIVFQLTISPSGKVTDVKIVSSELNNPALEARIISRIKMFLFAPTAGEPVVVNYPVEFLP